MSKPGCESNEWVTVIKTVARSRFASDVISPNITDDGLDVDQADEISQPSIVSIDDNSNQPFIMEHFDAVDDDELERAMRLNDVYYSGSDDDENAYDVEVDYDEDADLDDEDEDGDQDKNINDEDTEDDFAL